MSAELLNIILPTAAALIAYWLRGRQPLPGPAPGPAPAPEPAPGPSDRPLLDLLLRLLRRLTSEERRALEAQAGGATPPANSQEIFFRVEVTPPQIAVHNPR